VLTVEHLRLQRRKGEVQRVPLQGLSSTQAEALLTTLVAVAIEHHGRTQGELVAALAEVDVDPSLQRGLRAACKLVIDQCDFAVRDDVDPADLRQRLFAAAAAARATGTFSRDDIVAAIAEDTGLDGPTFEAMLYADLDEARLVDASGLRAMTPTELVRRWDLAEVQALLLRALAVRVDVEARPVEVRALLRALKLQQLLFEPVPTEGEGLALVIDGPAALFSQSLRYGLKLAVLAPHVMACRTWRLEAMVQLKKGAAPARFAMAGRGSVTDATAAVSSPLVQGLLDELPAALTTLLPGATVAENHALLAVPGVAACVPDVVVTAADGRRCFVEVLGFWSRDAVWKRVALAQAGLSTPAVFCVSERLRVSEAALDADDASLLAFKGSLSPKKVAERVARVLGVPTGPG
jgi:predicted nuclease of restriction endonuclease-like RecB superfamily